MAIIFKLKRKIEDFVALFREGNLRTRYVSSLLLTAFLTIALQFIVQYNLYYQKTGLNTIQTVRNHTEEFRDIRKKLFVIQAYPNINKTQIEFNKITERLNQISQEEFAIWNGKQRTSVKENFSKQNSNIVDVLLLLQTEFIPEPEATNNKKSFEPIIKKIFTITSRIEQYLDISEKQLELFDKELSARLDRFRVLELSILVIILSVLAFEAFYIFTPALDKLNKALKARSDFFSKMGHEIRNPMNSILGMADLIESQGLSKVQMFYLKRLKKSSEGLLYFLNNVIEFAEIENKKQVEYLSMVKLSELMEEVSAVFFLDASKKGLLFYIYADQNIPAEIESDYIKLKHILVNLIGNAIKFTNVGHIAIKIRYLEKDNKLLFEVEDTGAGIAQEKQNSIFDDFVQEDSSIKRKFGGTGLGLAIVREYVGLLRGHITLDSKKNKGTTFTLSIPVKNCSGNLCPKLDCFDEIYVSASQGVSHWLSFHASAKVNIRPMSQYNATLVNNKKIGLFYDNLTNVKNSSATTNTKTYVICAPPVKEIFKQEYKEVIFLYPLVPWQITDSIMFTAELPVVKTIAVDNTSVLICDDSEDNRLILESYLRKYFTSIVTVNNGSDCLEALEENSFKVAFIDIQMPDMDGFVVIEKAKKILKAKDTIFVAFSAYNAESEKLMMKEAGFDYLLEKPLRENNFMEIIKKMKTTNLQDEAKSFEEKIKIKLLGMRKKFIQDKLNLLNALDAQLEENNLQKVETLGHQIKGSAATFNYENLSLLGGKIETAAKNKKIPELNTYLSELKNFLESESIL